MNSLRARYEYEREGIISVERPEYFFTYKIVEDEFHCIDMFLDFEHRGGIKVKEMMDEIDELAKSTACRILVSKVIAGLPNSEKSLSLQFRWGMKLLKCDGNIIYTFKELNG